MMFGDIFIALRVHNRVAVLRLSFLCLMHRQVFVHLTRNLDYVDSYQRASICGNTALGGPHIDKHGGGKGMQWWLWDFLRLLSIVWKDLPFLPRFKCSGTALLLKKSEHCCECDHAQVQAKDQVHPGRLCLDRSSGCHHPFLLLSVSVSLWGVRQPGV